MNSRNLAILLAMLALVAIMIVAASGLNPFSSRKTQNAQASAVGNGQQAASNAAGAQITDQRASNVARINRTAQEARHALWQEDDLDAAVSRYLTDLDRLRDQGRASVVDGTIDGRGQDADPEPAQAGDPDPAAGDQP